MKKKRRIDREALNFSKSLLGLVPGAGLALNTHSTYTSGKRLASTISKEYSKKKKQVRLKLKKRLHL